MKQRTSTGIAVAALLSVALLVGCTAQDQPETKDQVASPTGVSPTPVADPVSGTYTGTQTIELGDPPTEATHIYVELTCLSAGTLVLHDGDEVTCVDPNEGATRVLSSLQLAPGQDSVEIATSDPEVRYEVEAVYENGASVR